MRRRDFFGLAIGSTTFVWPHLILAQQSGKLPIIAFLGGATPAMWAPWTGAFVDRLKALGWIDGQTVKLEFRWAEGRPELITPLAQEFARLNPNVVIGGANDVAGTRAIRKELPTVPILFFANDPLGSGLVNSLARPSGNMTGISLQTLDLANKRFELLRETIPSMRRLAVMANANVAPTTLEMNTVQELARKFGIDAVPLEIRRSEDIESAFARLKTEQADALYVVIDALLNTNRLLIVRSAEAAKLPAIYGTHDWVRSGGLMSYGPNFPALFARLAEMADNILRGTKPEDIPVEQPTRFELVINLKTAKAIGVPIPGTLLARADDVIE
jgi:putative tryptophan/tyrosine transport system substrate-binding protein